MEDVDEITLINDLKLYEKITMAIVKIIGYGVGSLPMWPHVITHGLKPTTRAFSIQSISIPEHDTVIYRAIEAKNHLIVDFQDVKTLNQLIIKSASKHPKRKYLGKREVLMKYEEIDPNTHKKMVQYSFGDYSWKSYSEVLESIMNVSKKLIDLGFEGESRKMALFCNTSPEWIIMAFSLLNISSPFVTVYSTLSDESICYAFNLTEIYGVMVDEKTLPRILKYIDKLTNLKYIIIMSHLEPAVYDVASGPDHITFFDFSSFTTYCSQTDPNSKQPTDSHQVALIMFTSGSSGMPKGVMISHKNMIAMIASVADVKAVSHYNSYAAFFPLSHVFEFSMEMALTAFGSTIGYSTPLTILDTSPMIKKGTRGDLSVLRPTLLIAVPLLLERVKKGILEQLKNRSRLKQLLFQTCYSMKIFYRKYGYNTPILDRIVFKPLRSIFGGRVKMAFIGGSYIARDTEEFINVCIGNFHQGYGLTETCAAVLFTHPNYCKSGSAGSPLAHCEIKLLPWEEGNYNPNDKVRPSGEIAVFGECVTLGYYKDEALTNASYVTDPKTGKRWFLTGDIALVLPDGTMKIVDRKKDIIKLLHGEYVSLVKVESVITSSPMVDIVCVLPAKKMSHLVALIIPNRQNCKKFLIKNELATADSDIDALLKENNITSRLAQHISSTVEKEFSRYDLPQKFYVLPDIWTPESNLITPTIKLKRPEISKFYAHLLE